MKHGFLEELGDARSVQVHLQAGRLTCDLRAQHLNLETKYGYSEGLVDRPELERSIQAA